MLNESNSKFSKDGEIHILIYPDGRQVIFLQEGMDEEGAKV